MLEYATVHVVLVDRRLRPALRDLQVTLAQHIWVGSITDVLADLAQCPGSESMAILRDATVIGHYRIDPHPRSVAGHDFALSTLGLRAFFIDARWQGQGLGGAALHALLEDLARRHPDARQVVLTVSCDNDTAQHLYRRHGFIDTGERYHGGRSGTQILLLRALP